jgi:predicted nucleic acid-binding protein
MPQAVMATDGEVLTLIAESKLAGLGIGYLDAHLLASAKLSHAALWTRDKKGGTVADKMGLGFGG